MELTVFNIPPNLERALRLKAQADGKTLDQLALEALSAAADVPAPSGRIDLSAIAGTWVEDPVFDEIRRDHDRIDPDTWK